MGKPSAVFGMIGRGRSARHFHGGKFTDKVGSGLGRLGLNEIDGRGKVFALEHEAKNERIFAAPCRNLPQVDRALSVRLLGSVCDRSHPNCCVCCSIFCNTVRARLMRLAVHSWLFETAAPVWGCKRKAVVKVLPTWLTTTTPIITPTKTKTRPISR